MSYVDPGTTEAFTFRTRKSIITQPSKIWYNTYEARFFGSPATEQLDQLAEGLAVYEQNMLLNVYKVDTVSIGTWAEDSHPYNPLSFITQTKNKEGIRPVGIGTPADLRTTLYIKRVPEAGRVGRIFLRGFLLVGDLTSSSGEWALADFSAIEDLHNSALGESEIHTWWVTGESLLKLSLIGESGLTREIEDFQLGGTTQVKLNHKYFNHS